MNTTPTRKALVHEKLFVIPLMLAILCLFAGCVIIPVEKNFVYDAENVASIEVYYIEAII